MLIGVIADDFTGAGDIANALANGPTRSSGLVTAQYLGVPDAPAAREIEAGVVSLKSRSVPVRQAVESSLEALHWLRAQGSEQIVFKYCSTFDSTPGGNIGPVAEALAEALDVRGVVVCPAFPEMGRTVYQGHLFVGDRLLDESGMENHPLTPMTDADIRRWLRLQTSADVGHTAFSVAKKGAEAVKTSLTASADRGETLVVVDAITGEDLITIGHACADAPLVTGGSGIARGLAENFVSRGLAAGSRSTYAGVAGPGAILAGSCSGTTRHQVEVHARRHPSREVRVDDVVKGHTTSAELVEFVDTHRESAPIIYSSASPEEVSAAQARYGRQAVSDRLETLFAETAKLLRLSGITRIVVAGGETSGAVAQTLDLGGLRIGPEISPGVPVLVSDKADIALALKSGNFGNEDFFDEALEMLAGKGAGHE